MSVKPANFEIPLRQAIAELERRHGIGETDVCESVLSEFPELREHRDSVLELIYFEYVLSQESGCPISDDALHQRFPEFQADLQKILNVDRAFRNAPDTEHAYGKAIGHDLEDRSDNNAEPHLEFEGFGDYELVGILGQGGMGVVYKARQRRLNRFVAVKTVDTLSSLNPVAVARFRSEAELVAKLQHPNIVQVYEIGSQLGVPYFSMELVDGGTLADAMSERPLLPTTAARIVETLARAVHYAHGQSIVHRDLKPANVLLARSDREESIELPVDSNRAKTLNTEVLPRYEPKIVDFGLAKYLEGVLDRTATQAVMGTPSYMAPELIDAKLGTVGPWCDIYSLGAILYDALVGRPPFSAATVIETIQQVRNSDVIPPLKLQSKIPRDLETICLKCLRKEPSKRYTSAKDLADDLQRFLAGQPIQARPTGIVEHTWKWTRRHPSLASLIAAVMVALVCIACLWLRSEQSRVAESLALKRNDQLLYDRDVSLAQFEYQSNRVERSREILDNTRPEYRGWEWDYLYNQTKKSIWESPKQPNPIVQADISPDGNLVAIASGVWGQDDAQAFEVWDVTTNERKWRFDGHPPSEACDVQFSPDGSLLLTAARVWNSPNVKGGTKVWDVSSGQLRFSLPKSNAYVARFSRDGESIFVGENEGWVRQYSVKTGTEIRKYVCSTLGSMILDLDFSPDGSRMVVAARDLKVSLWDTTSGKMLQKLSFDGDPRKLTWSPDGKTISVSYYSGLRTIFGIEADRLEKREESKEAAIVYGDFTPDGSRFVSSVFGQSIDICDARTGHFEFSLPAHNGHTKCIAFDASGRRMVTGGGDNRVRVWDLSHDTQQPSRSITWGAVVSAIAFDPKKDEMALAMQKHPNKKHAIEIREVKSHRFVREMVGHTDWPTCVAYSSDESLLVSGSLDKTVRIWDTSTGSESTLLAGHQEPVVGVSFLPNSPHVVSVDSEGVVVVWNVGSKSIDRSWKTEARVKAVSFHPTLPWIVFASKNKRVELWDVLQGVKRGELPNDGDVSLVCFSPNGDRLATVADDKISRIWRTQELVEPKQANPISELQGHSDTITSISFSPDGKRLVSLSRDESVRLFDVDHGYELFRLDSDKGTSGIVQFSVDGKSVVRTLPGNFSTWSIRNAVSSDSSNTTLESKAWHKAKSSAAMKNGDYFAAAFHYGWLIQLDPATMTHYRDRANARMLLGDFSEAEQDLIQCDGKIDASGQKRLLADLASLYLGQEKSSEYHSLCLRLFNMFRDSKNPIELNTILWFCALGNETKLETETIQQSLESLIADPKMRKPAYLNTLALCHYRDRDYIKAIDLARESIRLLKGVPSPSDRMIIALAAAKLDEQQIGWLPKFIRTQIRSWGFSRSWAVSLQNLKMVDTWMLEQAESTPANATIAKESNLLLKIELPYLRKEWESIANSP